ncbi:MAG: S-layer homology domain-containing protein [Acidithiobacillales bacterium]
MSSARKGPRLLGLSVASLLAAAVAGAQLPVANRPLLTARVAPREFGIQNETITAVTAASFTAISASGAGLDIGTPVDLRTFGRFCADCASQGVMYFATMNIPAGAVIDFIGVNNKTDTDEVFHVALFERNKAGHVAGLVGFAVPAHDWDTDYDGPLNVPIPNNRDHQYVLFVEQDASPRPQYLGGVEVWWHRTVSPPPAIATFGDVPTSHPFFQFIEALAAAGITNGCGGGNFCPDAPVTRAQVAVFLSRALGLHFPN